MNSDPHHPQCLEQFLIHSRCSIGIYYIEKEDTLVRSRSQHSSRSLTKGYSGLCPTIFIPISFFPPRRTNKHSHHSPICLSFMRFLCIIFDVSCFCHYIYLLYLLACLFFILTAKAAQNCRWVSWSAGDSGAPLTCQETVIRWGRWYRSEGTLTNT